MCRSSCTTPDYRTLPKGPTGLPTVHGLPMTEEEYRVTGWHSRGSHTTDSGTTEQHWIAPMTGHIAWGRLERQRREQRIAGAVARREADDEWSDHIASLVEEHRP